MRKASEERRARIDAVKKDARQRAGRSERTPEEKLHLRQNDPGRLEPPGLGDPVIEEKP